MARTLDEVLADLKKAEEEYEDKLRRYGLLEKQQKETKEK